MIFGIMHIAIQTEYASVEDTVGTINWSVVFEYTSVFQFKSLYNTAA